MSTEDRTTGDPYRPKDVADALNAITLYSFDKRAAATVKRDDIDGPEKLRRIYDGTTDPFARKVAEEGIKVSQEEARD